jgi:hypothetical protein
MQYKPYSVVNFDPLRQNSCKGWLPIKVNPLVSSVLGLKEKQPLHFQKIIEQCFCSRKAAKEKEKLVFAQFGAPRVRDHNVLLTTVSCTIKYNKRPHKISSKGF